MTEAWPRVKRARRPIRERVAPARQTPVQCQCANAAEAIAEPSAPPINCGVTPISPIRWLARMSVGRFGDRAAASNASALRE